MGGRSGGRVRAAAIGLAVMLGLIPLRGAWALILGGKGNEPIQRPDWPKGAAAVFNVPGRVAWWEGPPFGGGQWHAECRGDAKALSAVLADFARLDVTTRRVVLHDGVGQSFWLNPNREPAKKDEARIDWTFMVWGPAQWKRLRGLPPDLNPTNPKEGDNPPAQIDVYTGGNVRWADVKVPEGLKVVDERLEAHGHSAADGLVIEGRVTDLATGKPLAARVRLERVEPQAKGGYAYPAAGAAAAGGDGRWSIKKAPAGWLRVVVEADGYVPRVAGYLRTEGQPGWQTFDLALAKPGPVAGRVTDEQGRPLAGVEVRLGNLAAGGARYQIPDEVPAKTDADGRFRDDRVPVGTATVWVHKPGYVRPGLGPNIETPNADVALTMMRSAQLRVTVDFSNAKRPPEYIVELEPEGGSKIGSWGGSSQIDVRNQVAFRDVPAGRYVLRGKPNPSTGDQQTEPVSVDLKSGATTEATLKAR